MHKSSFVENAASARRCAFCLGMSTTGFGDEMMDKLTKLYWNGWCELPDSCNPVSLPTFQKAHLFSSLADLVEENGEVEFPNFKKVEFFPSNLRAIPTKLQWPQWDKD